VLECSQHGIKRLYHVVGDADFGRGKMGALDDDPFPVEDTFVAVPTWQPSTKFNRNAFSTFVAEATRFSSGVSVLGHEPLAVLLIGVAIH
jgi:hypothetical protein